MKPFVAYQVGNITLALFWNAAVDELIKDRVKLFFRQRSAFKQNFKNCEDLFVAEYVPERRI